MEGHLVGESLRRTAADTATYDRKLSWISGSRLQDGVDGQQQVGTTSTRACLLLVVRLGYLSLLVG